MWSTGGMLVKRLSPGLHPLGIAGARSAVAALTLLAFARRRRFAFSRHQIGLIGSYAATVILFVVATRLTTAANAILLQYTAPIYVALLGWWFLREKATARDWLLIAVVLAGIGLFFCDQLSEGQFWGNLTALGGAVSYAWMVLFIRKLKHADLLEPLVLGNLLAAVVGLPFMLGKVPAATDLLILLVLVTVQLGLPFILLSIASRGVTALDLILIPAIEPILNPIWVWLLIGETPGRWAVLGGLIVLSAVTFRGLAKARQPGDSDQVVP